MPALAPMRARASHATAAHALDCFAQGLPIILTDAGGAGHLTVAAEHAGAGAVNLMANEARGLVCIALGAEIVDRLGLPLMAQSNRKRLGRMFTVSVEAQQGISTGISTEDRARTIAALIAPDASPGNIASPGHMFPIRIEPGIERVGEDADHTAVALCRALGQVPAAVLAIVLNDEGGVAEEDDIRDICEKLRLPHVSCQAVAESLVYNEVDAEVFYGEPLNG